MPQEHVELVRRVNEAWNRNDWQELEACYAPDVVVTAPQGWPEAGERRGWQEARVQFELLKDSWGKERAEVEEVTELAGERVLTRFRWITEGRTSGVESETRVFSLATIRAGRIARMEFFVDEPAALEAAGLKE